MGDRHLAVPAAHARCQRLRRGQARRNRTRRHRRRLPSSPDPPPPPPNQPRRHRHRRGCRVLRRGTAAAVVTGASVAVRPGADLSAGAGPGCRASCAAAAGVRGRASGATCRPPPAPGSPPKAVPPPPPATRITSAPKRTADPPPPALAPKDEGPRMALRHRTGRTRSRPVHPARQDGIRLVLGLRRRQRSCRPFPVSRRPSPLPGPRVLAVSLPCDPARGALDDECGVARRRAGRSRTGHRRWRAKVSVTRGAWAMLTKVTAIRPGVKPGGRRHRQPVRRVDIARVIVLDRQPSSMRWSI